MELLKKALVVGLDGASFDLMMPWIEQGYLPNLGRVVKEGAYGNLLSTLDFTPPGWSSIYTGKNPGKHGIFGFTRQKQGSYKPVAIDATRRDGKDLWEILSDAGRRVTVFNTPVTYPPRPVNGQFVCGFMTPSEDANYTYPPQLKQELKSAVKGYKLKWPKVFDLGFATEFYLDSYLKNLHLILDRQGKASIYLANRYPWDFFMLVFSEPDVVQHGFWACMDKDSPITLPINRTRYRDAILDVYRRIDSIVGRMLTMADDGTYVVLVSDHGAGPLDKVFHINMFLKKIGLLEFKTTGRTRIKRLLHRVILKGLLRNVQDSLRLYTLAAILARLAALTFSDIDWKSTRAFSVGAGQIYVNLKGREPEGIVEPGVEYEKVRQEIVKGLMEVRDPNNGKLLIRDVKLKEDFFSGPHISEAPDLQFFIEESYKPFPWGAIGEELFSRSLEWTGNHTQRGIFAIKGPGVQRTKIEGATVFDVAPTILYAMGLPIPDDMDGRVLTSAFGRSHMESRPISFADSDQKTNEGKFLSKNDEDEIEERLRGMGYLG